MVQLGAVMLRRHFATSDYAAIGSAWLSRMAPNPQNKVSRFLLVGDLVLSYAFFIGILGEVYVIKNV